MTKMQETRYGNISTYLSDRGEPLTNIFTNLLPVSTYEEEEDELEPGILTCWPIKKDANLALTLCHCLYVIDAEVREIGFNAVVFEDCQLGPVDCTAIVNFLKKQNEILMIDFSS